MDKLNLYSQNNNSVNNIKSVPSPPEGFTEDESEYWGTYCEIMIQEGNLTRSILPTLSDLCRWEVLKMRAFEEVPADELFMTYYNEQGEISHTQPHAALSNYKSIQATINTLRDKLGITQKEKDNRSMKSGGGNVNISKKDW